MNTNTKYTIAACVILVLASWQFRYDLTTSGRPNATIRLDRWTGTIVQCIDDGPIFKCGEK